MNLEYREALYFIEELCCTNPEADTLEVPRSIYTLLTEAIATDRGLIVTGWGGIHTLGYRLGNGETINIRMSLTDILRIHNSKDKEKENANL